MNFFWAVALGSVLAGAAIGTFSYCQQDPERVRLEQVRRLAAAEARREFIEDCLVSGNQPITGTDFYVCLKRDAIVNIPPRSKAP